MKKQLLILAIIFCAGSSCAMQQQREQQEEQSQQHKQQKKKHKNKQNQQHNDTQKSTPVAVPQEDEDLSDLTADMAAIVQTVQETHGSITNMIAAQKKKTKEHERICPTCGRPAAVCPEDQRRIANGVIMTCGCNECGGLQI